MSLALLVFAIATLRGACGLVVFADADRE